ncbi:hypothetical protein AVEN_93015-1, partial [Araneus ventricosus]
PCIPNPCKNYGECRVHQSGFKCDCVVPWNGETCEEKIFCVEKKCYGGKCVIQNGVETCICPEDYVAEGNECRKVTTCIPSTCYGGRCEKKDGKLVCVCPDGFHLKGVGCFAKPPVRSKIASVDNAEW